MSMQITMSGVRIKQPQLLKRAVESINKCRHFGKLEIRLQENDEGEVHGGYIRGESGSLRIVHPRGKPIYKNGELKEGSHFVLMGDEDFRGNHRLGELVGDAYAGEVARKYYEEAKGDTVEMVITEEGYVDLEMTENEQGLALSQY